MRERRRDSGADLVDEVAVDVLTAACPVGAGAEVDGAWVASCCQAGRMVDRSTGCESQTQEQRSENHMKLHGSCVRIAAWIG